MKISKLTSKDAKILFGGIGEKQMKVGPSGVLGKRPRVLSGQNEKDLKDFATKGPQQKTFASSSGV